MPDPVTLALLGGALALAVLGFVLLARSGSPGRSAEQAYDRGTAQGQRAGEARGRRAEGEVRPTR